LYLHLTGCEVCGVLERSSLELRNGSNSLVTPLSVGISGDAIFTGSCSNKIISK